MPESIIGQTLLNQFRVDAFVASGGMGSVFRVWDLKRNVPLAMKVLHSELADDPHIFKRFKREANALKKLTHPHIVQFFGLFQTGDLAFLLERYIDGPSLKDILRKKKQLPVDEALVYLKALSSALGYAHANGVVHCDVKPGNVLLDQGGNIYLTDFGIARHAESTTTTMAGAGTAAYMAPEQIRGDPVTPATDIYALGVMLFEMLTGQRPFRGNEAGTERGGDTANERIRYAHLHHQPPDPQSLNPNISAELARVILNSLSKDVDERYTDIQKFFFALCTALGTNFDKIRNRVIVEEPHSYSKVSTPLTSSTLSSSVPIKTVPDQKYFILFGGLILTILVAGAIFRSTYLRPTLEPSLSSTSQTDEPSVHIAITDDIAGRTPTVEPTITSITNSVISPIDGAVLIRIPAGEFLRGLSEEQAGELLALCPACQRDYIADEFPQRQIYLDEFWIDQTEVTNEQFARFIMETGYVTTAEQKSYKASYVFNLDINNFKYDGNAYWMHPHGATSTISGLDATPVTQVSWEDADTYCQWAGRRLPTEAEWEKAARGTDGYLFAWGNELPSPQFLNFNLAFIGPRPTGSYTAGASTYGLYDMAGNLWEWVADFYNENYYQTAPDRNPTGPQAGEGHSFRGGSWASEYRDLYLITTTSRLWNRSYVSSDVLGFRCATGSP